MSTRMPRSVVATRFGPSAARRGGRPRARPPRPRAALPPGLVTASVPRLWAGQVVVCAGSGPSLTAADLDRVRAAGVPLIVVNEAYRLAPWADVLYAADAKWWKWHQAVPDADLPARCYTVHRDAVAYRPAVQVLQWNGHTGLSQDPRAVRLGGHSGYQAINLAALGGARRIVLLGYDMQPALDGTHHFHGDHPDGTHVTYLLRIGNFASLTLELAAIGVALVNASRATAIPASIIPRQPLEDALAPVAP
jgi:hypothetical protein